MNRWVYIILLLLCSSVFAFGQTRNDTDLSLSDHAREVAERNAAQGFNDTIDRLDPDFVRVSLVEYTHIILATSFSIILLKQKYMNR